MALRFAQEPNAQVPIEMTLFGMVTEVTDAASSKIPAYESPSLRTGNPPKLLGKTIDPPGPL
jgi:hypothetical protein